MKILLTGVTGMLGRQVYKTFKNQKNIVLGIARNRKNLELGNDIVIGDLTDKQFVKNIAISFNPDVVIHTAANVNVNSCDVDKKYTHLLNSESAGLLAKSCRDATFVYISTDAVYDGKIGNYDENSLTNPLNYYAISKLNGEKLVTDATNKAYIMRLNIYGFHNPTGQSLFEWAINNLRDGKEIVGFKNVFFNPLYTNQVAHIIEKTIIDQVPFGTYHLGADSYISKYDFLIKIAERFNLDKSLIDGVNVNNNSMGVVRAMNTTIKNNKIKLFLPDTDFSIETGIDTLYKDFLSGNI
jgi:dTDP-4-dehydrorhamnose reductase